MVITSEKFWRWVTSFLIGFATGYSTCGAISHRIPWICAILCLLVTVSWFLYLNFRKNST